LFLAKRVERGFRTEEIEERGEMREEIEEREKRIKARGDVSGEIAEMR
jgi:hypothetical protein